MLHVLPLALAAFGKYYLGKTNDTGPSSPPPTTRPVYCSGCTERIIGDFYITNCCSTDLCPSCYSRWKLVGGRRCVICNR